MLGWVIEVECGEDRSIGACADKRLVVRIIVLRLPHFGYILAYK